MSVHYFKLINHFHQTRLTAPLTDKHCLLDSQNVFCSGYQDTDQAPTTVLFRTTALTEMITLHELLLNLIIMKINKLLKVSSFALSSQKYPNYVDQ